MNPWIAIGLFLALVYYLIDLIVRRKKWSNNTKEEKISLVLGMAILSVYAFCSALGMLIGIVGGGGSVLSEFIHQATIAVGAVIWLLSLVSALGSIILRKKGKARASIMIHLAGGGSCALMFLLIVLSEIIP